MDATRSQQPAAGVRAAQGVMPKETGVRRMDPSAAPGTELNYNRKSSGFGLPCVKCHLYYSADLDSCPTCHTTERVSPVAPQIPPKLAQAEVETVPDGEVIEHEREEFLRQFKSQLFAAHAEVASAPATACTVGEHHAGEPAKAEICKHCYDQLQERMDVCEGALHMDLKEAAQIIYDAVWADPSDPSKTYQNAAIALLTELRKRSGLTTLMSPFQPLAH
jgi:hypothetical protein